MGSISPKLFLEKKISRLERKVEIGLESIAVRRADELVTSLRNDPKALARVAPRVLALFALWEKCNDADIRTGIAESRNKLVGSIGGEAQQVAVQNSMGAYDNAFCRMPYELVASHGGYTYNAAILTSGMFGLVKELKNNPTLQMEVSQNILHRLEVYLEEMRYLVGQRPDVARTLIPNRWNGVRMMTNRVMDRIGTGIMELQDSPVAQAYATSRALEFGGASSPIVKDVVAYATPRRGHESVDSDPARYTHQFAWAIKERMATYHPRTREYTFFNLSSGAQVVHNRTGEIFEPRLKLDDDGKWSKQTAMHFLRPAHATCKREMPSEPSFADAVKNVLQVLGNRAVTL